MRRSKEVEVLLHLNDESTGGKKNYSSSSNNNNNNTNNNNNNKQNNNNRIVKVNVRALAAEHNKLLALKPSPDGRWAFS